MKSFQYQYHVRDLKSVWTQLINLSLFFLSNCTIFYYESWRDKQYSSKTRVSFISVMEENIHMLNSHISEHM